MSTCNSSTKPHDPQNKCCAPLPTPSPRASPLPGPPLGSPFTSPRSALASPRSVPTTFYRRPLPSATCIAFSSPEGRQLFTEALAAGGMGCFFPLIEHFHTQSDPAYCGLGSLTMVLNALAIDPGRAWKGPWRWFDESLLDCCEPLEVVQTQGISLVKAHCLARCNGAKSRLRHGDTVSLQEFRDDIRRVTSASVCLLEGGGKTTKEQQPPPQEEDEFMLCGYSRKLLGQTGDGHFSPIGGYHAAKDLVLILDVARFKYPPHWVPLPLLHAALQSHDPATGKARGYLLLSQNRWSEALLLTLDQDRFGEWPALRDWLLELHQEKAQAAIKGEEGREDRVLCLNERGFRAFVAAVPEAVASLITTYAYLKCTLHDSNSNSSSSSDCAAASRSKSKSSNGGGRENPQEAFLRPLVRAIEAHPAFALLPPPGKDAKKESIQEGKEGGKEEGVCCPPMPVDERHALVVFFFSLVAWAGEGDASTVNGATSSASSSWIVEDEALRREVTQLKVRLQALATELSSSLAWGQQQQQQQQEEEEQREGETRAEEGEEILTWK